MVPVFRDSESREDTQTIKATAVRTEAIVQDMHTMSLGALLEIVINRRIIQKRTRRLYTRHCTELIVEKRQRILEWVYPREHDTRHYAISKQRMNGSGEWVLRTDQFRIWEERSSSGSLFLHGFGTSPVYLTNEICSRRRKISHHVFGSFDIL